MSIKNKICLSSGVLFLLLMSVADNARHQLNNIKNSIFQILKNDDSTIAMGNHLIKEVNISAWLF